MVWTKEETPRNHNAWQVPKSEVTIHEETAAVEDLNIYPENLSLLPTLIQHGQTLWQLQSVNINFDWVSDHNFYVAPGSWIGGFYAVTAGWLDGFYAVLGGWLRDSGFYPASGNWVGGFYPPLSQGWLDGFYASVGGWADAFSSVLAGWTDGFYASQGGWYLSNEAV